MLRRSFSVLEIFKTSPIFHIKIFFNLQWLFKSGCTLHHKYHVICSLQLEDFSHQSSWAVWNVNLNYLCNRQTRVLNPSLFHYIIDIKNGLVSRKSLISSIFIMSHLKTLIIFFPTKSSIPELFLQLFVVTFTNFLTKGIFIKIFVTILDCSSFQLYLTSHLQ